MVRVKFKVNAITSTLLFITGAVMWWNLVNVECGRS
jgi:hypothetical protein